MRGTLPGLATPHPLGQTLPGLYADDDFAQALCEGLDEVLAPVIATLDNLPSYLDLGTAPPDLLPWLARWVGLPVRAPMPVDRLRELLQSAAELQGWAGTARGIALSLEALFGVAPQIEESGGSTWSTDPHAALPGRSEARVTVRLVPVDGAGQDLDEDQVRAAVAEVVPAQVLWEVQVER